MRARALRGGGGAALRKTAKIKWSSSSSSRKSGSSIITRCVTDSQVERELTEYRRSLLELVLV